MEQIIHKELYLVHYNKIIVKAEKIGQFMGGRFLEFKLTCPLTKREVKSIIPISRCEKIKETES